MKRLTVFTFAVLSVAIPLGESLCASDEPFEPTDPSTWTLIENDEYVGYVIPVSWRASKIEIEEFESELGKTTPHKSSDYLDRFITELHLYRRYYLCTEREGTRFIQVSFFHEESRIVKDGIWGREFVTVHGGGDVYVKATYDAETKSVLYVMPNHP